MTQQTISDAPAQGGNGQRLIKPEAIRGFSPERQARIGAGTLALLGVTLGFFVHPLFYALVLVVGVGLIFAGLTDICGLALLVAKLPWNRHGPTSCPR